MMLQWLSVLVFAALLHQEHGSVDAFALRAVSERVNKGTRLNAVRSSSPQFIRLLQRSVRGSRKCFEVQTAVTTLERQTENGEKETIDLHAQLHFGQQDYFDYYSSSDFDALYDRIHYELIIDENMLHTRGNGLRYLTPSQNDQPVLMASPTDQQTARQYDLVCQVDTIDYTLPKWIHADFTRQELLDQTGKSQSRSRQEPIWALASTAPTWPGSEAVSALFRPSTPSTPLSSPVTRRLFSNLFLPGNALVGLFRSLFWLAVPSPELSVMLLDWSSILPRPTGGISQVALPVVESLLTGNLQEARQLVFGQMLVSGQRSSSNEELLIQRRNDKAMKVLEKSLTDGCQRNAILYGGMHCPDLQRKLLDVGFRPTKTCWRTAWSVNVPNFGYSFAASASPVAIGIGLVLLPAYFFVGGIDWVETLRDTASAVEQGNVVDASVDVLFYLVRHVLLYLSLAKFVVEWDGGSNLFGIDER